MDLEFGVDKKAPKSSMNEEEESLIPCSRFISQEQYLNWKNDPEGVFNALNFIEDKMNQIHEELDFSKAQIEQQDFDKELLMNQIEQENVVLKEELQQLTEEMDIQKESNDELRLNIQRIKQENVSFQNKFLDKETELLQLKNEKQRIEEEKRQLLNMMQQTEGDTIALEEEIASQSVKIQELTSKNLVLEEKISDSKHDEMSIPFLKEKFSQEKQILEKQNKWLNEELNQKSQELLQIRNELSVKVGECESLRKISEQNTSGSGQKVQTLQKLLMEKENLIGNYLQEMRSMKIQFAQVENNLNDQIIQENKLSQMYKNSAKDYETKSNEFSKLYYGLKEKYEKEQESFHHEIKTLKEVYEASQNELNELRQNVSLREQQLEKSRGSPLVQLQDLLNQGLTTTDIYNKYVEVSEELIKEKNENNHLNEVLNQILKEIKEKGPLIQQQREDYEKLMSSHAILTKKYQKLLQDSEKKSIDFYNFRVHYDKLSEERNEFKSENDELSSQVQVLLKECQEYKTGKKMFDISTSSINDSTQLDITAPLISDDLATFKDVQQLQIKNRKLLQEVRRLTEEKESQIEKLTNHLTIQFKQKLQEAKNEVEKLTNERKKESELVQSIIKQRDMYKDMAKQGGESIVSNQRQSGIGSGFGSVEFKNLYEDSKKDRESLQQQYFEQKKQNRELQSTISKNQSEIKFLQESLSNSKMTLEPLKKDISILEEKNEKLITSNIQFQKSLEELKRIDIEKNQKIHHLEKEYLNQKSENKYLSERIERLIQDIADKNKNNQHQENLYFSLQSIQQHLQVQSEKNEKIATETINSLKKQISQLQENLENEKSLHKSKIIQMDLNSKQFEQELKKSSNELQSINLDLTKTKSELESLQVTNQKLNDKLELSENKLMSLIEKQISKENSKDINLEAENFIKLQQDLVVVNELLKKEKEHSKNYKILSEQSELNLKSMNTTFDQYKKTMELKLNAKEDYIKSLTNDISKIREDMNNTFKENDSLNETIQKLKNDYEMEKFELTKKSKDLEESSKKSEARINTLKEDLRRHIQLSMVSDAEKEKEVQRNTEVLSSLQKLSETIEENESSLIQWKEKAQSLESTLKNTEISNQKQKLILEENIKELKVSLEEKSKQNDILYNQIDTLTSQIELIKSSGVGGDIDFGSSDKNVQELHEAIRMIRKEKELISSKLIIEQEENHSIQQKLEQSLRNIEYLKSEIERVKKESMNIEKIKEKEEEIIKLTNQMNLYKESNITLRNENEENLKKIKLLQEELKKSKDILKPLEEEISNLKNEKELSCLNISRLEDDMKMWKDRVHQLYQKYNQVNPEEHKLLQQEKDILQKEKEQFEVTITELNKKMEELNSKKSEDIESSTKTIRNQALNIQKQLRSVQIELRELKEKFEKLTKENDITKEELKNQNETVEELQEEMKSNSTKYQNGISKARKTLTDLRETKKLLSTENANLKILHQKQVDDLKKKIEQAQMVNDLLKSQMKKQREQVMMATTSASTTQKSDTSPIVPSNTVETKKRDRGEFETTESVTVPTTEIEPNESQIKKPKLESGEKLPGFFSFGTSQPEESKEETEKQMEEEAEEHTEDVEEEAEEEEEEEEENEEGDIEEGDDEEEEEEEEEEHQPEEEEETTEDAEISFTNQPVSTIKPKETKPKESTAPRRSRIKIKRPKLQEDQEENE
eukprot:gene9048-1145_t